MIFLKNVFPIAIFSGKSMAHFCQSRWWSCGISHSMYDISTTNLSRVPEKTSGRFGRWPEGKLWLCLVQVGGFKCLLQAWTCSTRESFPWWSQKVKKVSFFSKLGPQVLWLMTHDPVYFWEFFASESKRIPVVNFKCRRFTYSCLENEVWSLASLNVFFQLAFENPLLFCIDGFGSSWSYTPSVCSSISHSQSRNSQSKFPTCDPPDLLPACFNPKSMLLIFIAHLPSSWVFLAKWCGISAHIQPSTVSPSFLKVSWSVPGLCFFARLEDWMMMFLILFQFAELHVLLMQRACATERVIHDIVELGGCFIGEWHMEGFWSLFCNSPLPPSSYQQYLLNQTWSMCWEGTST